MKFSLILCTLGRTEEVSVFILSLLAQDYNNYELIIIDQNADERINLIIEKTKFPVEKLKHIKQMQHGLSRARNLGLSYVDGDIIAFPDDDCCYTQNVLSSVLSFFSQSNGEYKIFSTNTKDATCDASLIPSPNKACDFNRLYPLGCSFTLFFIQSAKLIRFDERMGVGSGFIWGACEEHDFLFRFLGESGKGHFNPAVYVYHAAKEDDALDIKRAFYYGAGLAAYRMKHFSYFRLLKSATLIFWQSITNLALARGRKSIFKFVFLLGYIQGTLAWMLATR